MKVSPEITPKLEKAADLALSTGQLVITEGMTVVPDTLISEAMAQGHDPGTTAVLKREDDRAVYIYQAPPEIPEWALRVE